ncbi:MAG: polysaccharide deacetylase family protein [Proteobacteria bacterium]|nr:polysaccharide deacetylase family protein [Pseudomonadota bacterium]
MVRTVVALALALGLAHVASPARAEEPTLELKQAMTSVQPAAIVAPAPELQPQEQKAPSQVAPAQPKAPEPAKALACNHPGALGTSRTITVSADAFPRIGTMQYRQSLPLNDHEVVITFDDGPLPPYTDRVLDALDAECVKVTYFIVGQMARAYPDTLRRIYNDGHVIGTHSMHHPFSMDRMDAAQLTSEIDGGIAAVKAAIGDGRAVAPFFRVPGLARSRTLENFAASQSLAVWSADEVADDWFHGIKPAQIVERAMRRIEAKGHRGVLLLHDIHPATAMALPVLLQELKAKGYKIVQAVPAGYRPASVPERTPAEIAAARHQGWPRVVKASLKGHHARERKHIAATGDEDSFLAKLAAKKRHAVAAADSESGFFNR